MARIEITFGALVAGLISSDRELGFLVVNCVIVAFGVWCVVRPVRHHWPSAPVIMWLWVFVETINGVGHPAWSIREGGYTPGVITALILLPLAAYLAIQLRAAAHPGSPAV
jgi:hypothetical protein